MTVDQKQVMPMEKLTFKFKQVLLNETLKRNRFRLIKIWLNEFKTETQLGQEEIEWKKDLQKSKSRKYELS